MASVISVILASPPPPPLWLLLFLIPLKTPVLTLVLSSGFIYQHCLKYYFKKDETSIFVLPSFLPTEEHFPPNIYNIFE